MTTTKTREQLEREQLDILNQLTDVQARLAGVNEAHAAQLRAALLFLGPAEMTPSAIRMLQSIAANWEEGGDRCAPTYPGCITNGVVSPACCRWAELESNSIELTTGAVAEEIARGRHRAHAKHGADSIEGIDASDPRWLSILVEEVGEAAHELTYDATGSLRAELLDVATVAVAWIAAIDRADLEARHASCAEPSLFTHQRQIIRSPGSDDAGPEPDVEGSDRG